MKKLILLTCLCSALVASASFAQEKPNVRRVTRTNPTDNKVVVAVPSCASPAITSQWEDNRGNRQITISSTLNYIVCQEYVTYEADVEGKGWNAKETPVTGTLQYSYKQKNAQKTSSRTIYDDSIAETTLATLNVATQCNQQRELLVQLQKAQAGKSQCQ